MTDSTQEKRYRDDEWEDKAAYLAGARILLHNDDYLEFLVSRVWKLDRPVRVVDFGCGSGRFGLMLMPLLPKSSTYTGFDQSPALIEEGKRVFQNAPFETSLSVAEVHEAPYPDDSFDLAISQAVLMHVPDPMGVIREMKRVTRNGGMVITCDSNRNACNALMHTEELNTQEETSLSLIQTLYRQIRLQTGVDYNIGIKTPFLMHKAGLKNIGARTSDCIRLVLPPIDSEYDEAVFRAICEDGYGPKQPNEEERANWKAFLVKYGISPEEADAEIDRSLAQDFRSKGRDYHTAYPSLMTFSSGTVKKGQTCG